MICKRLGSIRKRGFTVIEALTVAAILSLLTALLLPAVQQARESARSLTCKSRLRSLAAATLQYESVHGMLPSFMYSSVSSMTTVPSVFSQILPYIEHHEIYGAINFDCAIVSPLSALGYDNPEFVTVRSAAVQAFICPSDGRTRQIHGGCSFRACVGNGPMWHRTATFPDSANGTFNNLTFGRPTPERFIDGLSFTAAFSERTVGGNSVEVEPNVRHAYMQNVVESLGILTADDQLRVCSELGPKGAFGVYWSMGSTWLSSGQESTLYTHAYGPNSGVMDCIAESYTTPLGAATARSMHPGNVNVAFADGSARSVSDAVSRQVWRALATRDGLEIVLASEF